MKMRIALGLAVSAAALAWIAHRYDLRSVGAAFREADPGWLGASLVALILSFAVRAARWRLLFAAPPRPSLRNAFGAMMAGYLFNNVLPARGGELVRVYLLGRAEAISKSRVLGTVALEKALELAVFAMLAIATVATRPVPDWLRNGAVMLLAVGLGAGLTVILVPRAVALATRALRPLLDRVPARLGSAAVRALDAFGEGLRGLRRAGGLARVLGCTALIWGAEIAMLALVARAFGITLSPGEALFVLVLVTAGTLIPAAPAYIGTFEMFGAVAFSFLGFAQETALACVLALHAMQLAGSCLLGGLGLATVRKAAGGLHAAEILRGTRPERMLADDHAESPRFPVENRP